MDYLSKKEALEKVKGLAESARGTNREKSLKEFNEIVGKLRPGTAITDKKFVFWSGGFSPAYKSAGSKWGNIPSNVATVVLSKQSSDAGVIRNSNYAKFLDHPDVRDAYINIYMCKTEKSEKGIAVSSREEVEAKKQYASGLDGPWAKVSQRTAENVRGDVLAFTPYETGKELKTNNAGKEVATSNNIFTEREFPALLKNSEVTSINGISIDKLCEIEKNIDIDAARHQVNLAARGYVSTLTAQRTPHGQRLKFEDPFMSQHSFKERNNFDKTLNNDREEKRNVLSISPEQAPREQASLEEKYKAGNVKHWDKQAEVGASKRLEGLPSRSGQYKGAVVKVTDKEVSQDCRGHTYVHQLKASKHNLRAGDQAKIMVSKGQVKSVEKPEMSKSKSVNLKRG